MQNTRQEMFIKARALVHNSVYSCDSHSSPVRVVLFPAGRALPATAPRPTPSPPPPLTTTGPGPRAGPRARPRSAHRALPGATSTLSRAVSLIVAVDKGKPSHSK